MQRPLRPTAEELAEANLNATVANLTVNLLIYNNTCEQLYLTRQSIQEAREFNKQLLDLLKERL